MEIVEEFEDSPAKSKKIMSTQSSSEDEDSDLEILASKIKSGNTIHYHYSTQRRGVLWPVGL